MRRRLPTAALLAAVAALAQPPARPLQVVDAGVRQIEDGPAVGAGSAFVPGETVFFSFQVQGYDASREGGVQLSYRIEVQDPEGIAVVEPKDGKLQAALTPQDKDWVPRVRHEFVLPPHALAGRFRVAVALRDERSMQEAKSETPFTVHSRPVDVSGPLAVRSLQFFKGGDDRSALTSPVYRAGDSLAARFDIVGFSRGEKNRIRVSYGVSILGPSGKVLFSVPQAAVEEDAPFYPKRLVPGEAALTVQPGTTPGEYTLVIEARDELGGAVCEARGTFRVE